MRGVILLVFMLSFLPLPVEATAKGMPQSVLLPATEVVDGDYFAVGESVVIDGRVTGDAYVAAGEVVLNGTIDGDLLVLAGKANVTGIVSQHIRGIVGATTLSGTVGKNFSVISGNITFSPSATVFGNVVAASGEASGLNEAQISGATTYHDLGSTPNVDTEAIARKSRGLQIALSFLSSLAVGLLLLWFMPNYFQKTAAHATKSLSTSLFYGFGAFVGLPVLAILLCMTVIGIPFGLLLFVLYFFLIYLSKLFAVFALGDVIHRAMHWKSSLFVTFFFGLLLYYVVGFVPVIGGIAKFILMLVGLGALIIQKKVVYHWLRAKKLL